MWRIACKWLCLLSAGALLLGSVAGCSSKSQIQYNQLFLRGIVIDNQLTVIEHVEDDSNDPRYSTFEIDGLKNASVEDSINRRIANVFDGMCSGEFLPPYRGMSVKLRQYDSYHKTQYVSVFPVFNANHLLSVSCSCSVWYNNDDYSDYFGYSYEVPLNFDLSTGEELTLKDLFASGTDYIGLINDKVDRYLLTNGFDSGSEGADWMLSSETTLVSPFKGIEPDQKFYIARDGTVCLLFDYDTPAFYTGFHALPVSLDMRDAGDKWTPYKAPGRSLFESEQVDCRFLSGYTDRHASRGDDWKPRVHFAGEYSYREDMPEAVIQQLEAMTFDQANMPIRLDEVEKRANEKLDKSKKKNIYVHTMTNFSGIGSTDYFGFSRTYSCDVSEIDAWTETNPDPITYSLIYETSYCFDREGKLLTLSDLFKRPEQANELLEKAMLANLKQKAEASDVDRVWDEEQARAYVKQLLPHINGTSVQTDCFYLSFDLTYVEFDDMLVEFFGNATGESDYIWKTDFKSGVSFLTYHDLGCENLTIFSDVFR